MESTLKRPNLSAYGYDALRFNHPFCKGSNETHTRKRVARQTNLITTANNAKQHRGAFPTQKLSFLLLAPSLSTTRSIVTIIRCVFYNPVQFLASYEVASMQFFQHPDFKIQLQTRSVGHDNRKFGRLPL
jgi:hypothetical protein